MARYIDAEQKITVTYYDEEHEEWIQKSETIDDFLENADEEIPTADVAEVVRCKDCIHHPTNAGGFKNGPETHFPDDVCPCQIGDNWYSWVPDDEWFCADGERRN